MATQTKTWQRKILEQAKATGYRDLFWYIEFSWWQAGQRHAPACHPGPWVPVVPVGPDPQASRNIADMLAHLFALSNEKRLTFAAALTSTEALAQTGCRHYLWFEDILLDAVCDVCGGVERVGHSELEEGRWLCAVCASRLVMAE